ncbi:hypothetical protein GUJ93_ZPchr0012g20230 [Zizania palustris]|uniref:Metallo-beta-lactamase domain-containing protein n=1 Tax=Zizania palustris TaxID=103762 RepID=A0A8J5WMV1_ZIZPA|nr:hypothetical protein GUJ93_ZPchr0012g20230 [Zizania palustris]
MGAAASLVGATPRFLSLTRPLPPGCSTYRLSSPTRVPPLRAYPARHLLAVVEEHSPYTLLNALKKSLLNSLAALRKPVVVLLLAEVLLVDSGPHEAALAVSGGRVSGSAFPSQSWPQYTAPEPRVIPLPVWPGKGYRSLGFLFDRICYISDVSDIPEETYKLMEGCELLILDALRPDRSSSTHFGLPRALEEVRKIKPKKTLFPESEGDNHTDGHATASSSINTGQALSHPDINIDGILVLEDEFEATTSHSPPVATSTSAAPAKAEQEIEGVGVAEPPSDAPDLHSDE